MSRGISGPALALLLIPGCGDAAGPTPPPDPSGAPPPTRQAPSGADPSPADPSPADTDGTASPAPNRPPGPDEPGALTDGDRQPWQLDAIKVSATPPPDSTVVALQTRPDAVLEYALGAPAEGDRVWIEPACPGGCADDRHAERVRADAERRREAVGGTFTTEPTETAPGLWTYRIAGTQDGTAVDLLHALHVVEGHDRMLHCHGRLQGAARARANAVLSYCTDLKFRLEDPLVRPNHNFHHAYELGGKTLEVPTPLGWRFTRYRLGQEVAFHNRRKTSKIVVRHECAGKCGEPLLDNAHAIARARATERKGRPGFSTTGLEEIVPGVYRQRVEYRAPGGPRLEVDAFAIRDGADRLLRCQVEVEGKVDFEQRDFLDKWCITVVRGWQ